MTIEVEPGQRVEPRKDDKIAAVAARGADLAQELGQDPGAVRGFLQHYFRHVDAADVDARSVPDLLGLVASHYRSALLRPAARAAISIRTPTQSADGWSAGGATVVEIVTDDHPFLVDSVTMEVLRQGWSIREIFHPQFLVRRDLEGTLLAVVRAAEARQDPTVLGESWMHLEILPPARTDGRETLVPDLEQGLQEVLRLVEETVEDWDKMRQRAADTMAALAAPPTVDGAEQQSAAAHWAHEAALAAELLTWLVADHFTFLGYREYALEHGPAGDRFLPRPATGLGILRADVDAPGAFGALPLPGEPPALLVVTKDNYRSRVHRSAYLDYLGFRIVDADGRVTGERRFLGLFSSSAYSESVTRIPVLRQKAASVLEISGYGAHSHGGKAILDVLEYYPRDELFQTPLAELAAVVEKVAHLKERRQVRLFVRRDPYGRYLSCLVYLPRDLYTTAVRTRMEELLRRHLGAASVDYTARVTESVLARLHFVLRMPVGEAMGQPDVVALEKELTLATRSWDDEFADALAERPEGERADGRAADELLGLAAALPEGYKEEYAPSQAVVDLAAVRGLRDDDEMALALDEPTRADDEAHLRLKIFRQGSSLSLSAVLPHLTLLGVDVIDERPYELALGAGRRAFAYDFGLTVPGGSDAVARRWTPAARAEFLAAFAASYSGAAEPDRFQALVMGAELSWRQVSLLRAIGRYLRQVGVNYSQTYIASALSANVDVARALLLLFETKFDPAFSAGEARRTARCGELRTQIERGLDDVASLDHDRILRAYLAVVDASIRTNFYQPDRQAIAVKLRPREIPELPEPRPAFEIFVYSPRLEGVHLRFGAVARGGLRWSDRAEDFRTEILGLVKAQMVKNTVIVPVGAKGGFYAKQLPDPTRDREAWLAEGVGCYQLFIHSLLDVTDNIVEGAVVPPAGVIRYDGDDPYLVVAADKGTATFSDIANAISLERGFWLGDAFASGGSAGYDHKAMGITARGAWESVRRHFRELGRDVQTSDFSCVGIGDMSGDVFGNGMLLSRHTRLVAAFDHRHIFLDPTPDPERSWAERARLFALPRSSWADYDRSLVSEGGGIFPRSLKSIPVSAPVRAALGLDASVTALSPTALIHACLLAPVDLLWNGGIGTYVKAATESHAAVGDKANDAVRVNGGQLRALCVGEGGNLGLTQLGRVEYALKGGRLNTDFIDNSAGVDTSDHEVNIKILLAPEVAAGRLTEADRDELLASMTDEVAGLVLAHNDAQNRALANSVYQAPSMAGVHEDWMARLSEDGLLDRELEALPSTEAMEARRSAHAGLTSPELCTLMAYTKIVLSDEVLASDLPDDPYLADRLTHYFPAALQQRYAGLMPGHRLHREIVATVVVNDFVNASGITCFHRISGETGAPAAEVLKAQIAARAIFGADELDDAVNALDHEIDAQTQTALRMEIRTLVERATRWLVNNRKRPLDIAAAVTEFADGVQRVRAALPALVHGRDAETLQQRRHRSEKAGVPAELAARIAALPAAYAALSVVATAHRTGLDLDRVVELHFALGQRLRLDRLLTQIVELPREDRWQTMARASLRDDLHTVHAMLTAEVLQGAQTAAEPTKELLARWERGDPAVADAARTLRSVTAGRADLARVSVGLRVVRSLLPGPS